MKIVISIDSLKGSLSSIEAANAIKKGILNVDNNAEIVIMPLADGGEGTVDALVEGMNGEEQLISVTGPIGEKVTARYKYSNYRDGSSIRITFSSNWT